MEQFIKRKKLMFLAVCMMLLTVLTGCQKETSYEGGHVAFSYDADKWELSYQEAEPYPVFDLHSEKAEIVIMVAEDDGSVLDSFHSDMIYLWETEGEAIEKDKTDKWDKEGILYYEDFVSDEEEAWYLITYGKRQEDKLMVGYAEIASEELGETDAAMKDEVLKILSALSYSGQEEIGDIEQDEEYESIVFIYDMLNNLVKYEIGSEEEAAGEESEDKRKDAETSVIFTDEEIESLTYIERISVEDYYGDKSMYDVYGPKGSQCENGYVSYIEHGLFYSASAYNMGTDSFLYSFLDEMIEYTQEEWLKEDSGYSDVVIGEMMKNGDDRYIIATAKKEDYNGVPYEEKLIYYMDAAGQGAGVMWELEMEERSIDDETYLIIDELAGCYGISLDQLKASGDWSENDKERIMQEQDLYDPGEDDLILEKVEGYQYMGIVTISAEANRKSTQCQVMAPMGQRTNVGDNYVGANMHGVRIMANINMLIQQNLMASAKMFSDIRYEDYIEDTEDIRNVWKSEMIPISGFEEAYYVVITYEEKDYITEEFVNKTDVMCFIRIDDDFDLEYYITLSQNEYDASTNTVIKELEMAYGIDLSEYYYESNK